MIRFVLNYFLWGNGAKGAVQVVNGFDQVFGEFGDGEIFGRLNVTFCAILEVAEFGDGPEVFVLRRCKFS